MPRPMTGWRGYGAAWVTSTRPGWLSARRADAGNGRGAADRRHGLARLAILARCPSRRGLCQRQRAARRRAARRLKRHAGRGVRHRAGLCGGQARRAPAGGPRAVRGRPCRARWPRLHRHHARCISHGAGHALYRGAPGAWHPRRGLRTPRASALPDLRRRSRRHPGQRRQRPGLGRRHRPRRLVKRSGAGLEPRPALVQRCGAAGGGGAIVPHTSKRVLVQAARNARISGTARLADPKRALELLLAQTRVRITDLPGLLLLR